MKLCMRTLFALGIVGVAAAYFSVYAQTTSSTVPREFYPNYTIIADWERIQEYFVQIEAAQKM